MILRDGTLLSADKILGVIAADFLTRHPGEVVVVDAMISAVLLDKIEAWGGKPILSITGHSHIEHAMKTHSALLGGEQSGHVMFGEDFYGHDDACLAALRFLRAVENNPHLLTEVTKGWPAMKEYSERPDVPDEKKFQLIERVSQMVKERYPEASTIDGVRIDYGNGEWAIIRASNTSPKIAIRIEARDESSLKTKKEELLGMVKAQG